ncbi:MAG: hypothetical protein JNK05_07845 [Myxococcales bacterium]|nr:hypothetical protein [Myxococcales bacterium]
MAFSIPLVRADGTGRYESGSSFGADELYKLTPLDPSLKNDLAKNTESILGLRGGLYFYAGWANARFGPVVFVFDAALLREVKFRGDCSSFDTGGLMQRWLHLGIEPDERVLVDWARRNTWPLQRFRARLRQHVLAHHRATTAVPDRHALVAYLRGDRPRLPDPEGRFAHPSNLRYAWTWEVRLRDPLDLKSPSIHKHLRRIVIQTNASAALDRLIDADATPAASVLWDQWHRTGIWVRADDPHEHVTRWLIACAQTGTWQTG